MSITYRVVASFDVEASDPDKAGRAAIASVIDALFNGTPLEVQVTDPAGVTEKVVIQLDPIACDACDDDAPPHPRTIGLLHAAFLLMKSQLASLPGDIQGVATAGGVYPMPTVDELDELLHTILGGPGA